MRCTRKGLRAALPLALAMTAMGLAGATQPAAAARAYHFAPSGADVNPCSESAPCLTLDKANRLPLAPGDRVLFRRSGTWAGELRVTRSGVSGANIVVGAYGAGAQPRFTTPPGRSESCLSITGSWVTLDNVETSDCGYAGVRVAGSHGIVKYVTSSRNFVGIFITPTARYGVYERNRLVDNNRMNVNTPSPEDDDSGAFGFLVQGDGNELRFNVISGSDAFSYDYERDGCAVEIYGASNTRVHHNRAVDNNCFAELGKAGTDGNRFEYNAVTSVERGTESPRAGSKSSALVTRGERDGFGPVTNTTFRHNSVRLHGNGTPERRVSAVVCFAGCTASSLELRANAIAVSGLKSQTGWVDAGFANSRANVFFPAAPVQLVRGPADVVADPGFTSMTDLHPLRTSPAVDRGCTVYWTYDLDGRPVPVDLTDRPNAMACAQHPDAGAYEVQF
jgi:hypothetical protein